MTKESLIELKNRLKAVDKFCLEDGCYYCPLRENRGCPLQQKDNLIRAIDFELASHKKKLHFLHLMCKVHDIKFNVPFVLGDRYNNINGVYVLKEDGMYLYNDNKPQTLALMRMYECEDGYTVIDKHYREPSQNILYV